jgi:hypothetical protein
MATSTISAYAISLNGVTMLGSTSDNIVAFTTGGTVTISDVTDLSRLFCRVTNTSTTASITLSVGVGTEYTSKDIGAKTITVATAGAAMGGLTALTVIWCLGDSARYKTSAETVVITIPTAATGYIEAGLMLKY